MIPLLKIAVCDDKYEHLKKISNMLERYFQAHSHASAKVEIFLSGAALLNRVEEAGGFDLYILDILMPEQSGIDIGRRLRKLGAWGELIFLSHSNDYAADSYDLRAFFYLLKPVEEGKLFRVLDQAIEKAGQQKQQAIVVETREGPRRILLEKILYSPPPVCHLNGSSNVRPDPSLCRNEYNGGSGWTDILQKFISGDFGQHREPCRTGSRVYD